jgi:membrane dipeptidase
MMTIDDWVGVVDRAIQMGGEDHVAIGTDFDRGPTLARGMRDVLRFTRTRALANVEGTSPR